MKYFHLTIIVYTIFARESDIQLYHTFFQYIGARYNFFYNFQNFEFNKLASFSNRYFQFSFILYLL